MASGVTVSSEAKTLYEQVKKDKSYRYIIYHIRDDKEIEVESTGPRDTTYAQFFATLQDYSNQCRYALFDFPSNVSVDAGNGETSMTVDRLVLLTWCPEGARMKQKMLYSSSFDALKKALVGVYKYVQACDFEEVSQSAIEDAVRSKK